jgi:hypothetical protein
VRGERRKVKRGATGPVARANDNNNKEAKLLAYEGNISYLCIFI